MNDRTYMGLTAAERLVLHWIGIGVTFEHLPGGVIRVSVPLDLPIEVGPLLEAVAEHTVELLALLPEVMT